MTMEAPKKQQEKTTVPLQEVQINIPEFATPERQSIHKVEDMRVSFNGVNFILRVESSGFYIGELGSKSTLNFVIKAMTRNLAEEKNNPYVSIVVMNSGNGSPWALTAVESHERKLPGLGREIWRLSLSVLQAIADKMGKPILHKVIRMPKNGLPGEKWNQLFYPLLEQYGYRAEEEDSNTWVKIYQPK